MSFTERAEYPPAMGRSTREPSFVRYRSRDPHVAMSRSHTEQPLGVSVGHLLLVRRADRCPVDECPRLLVAPMTSAAPFRPPRRGRERRWPSASTKERATWAGPVRLHRWMGRRHISARSSCDWPLRRRRFACAPRRLGTSPQRRVLRRRSRRVSTRRRSLRRMKPTLRSVQRARRACAAVCGSSPAGPDSR